MRKKIIIVELILVAVIAFFFFKKNLNKTPYPPTSEYIRNGTWILENGSKEQMKINNREVTISLSNIIGRNDSYVYQIKDSIEKKYLILSNDKSVFEHEILTKNDTVFRLKHLLNNSVLSYKRQD